MSGFRATLLRALIALGLSFSLWAFVSFSQNPEETVQFDDLPVQTIGLGEGLVIVDANGLPGPPLPTVDLTLRTDRAQRNELRPLDFRLLLDLEGLGPGDHSVPVRVQTTRNISYSVPADGAQPTAVLIRLEQVLTRTVPIDLQVVGNLPFSFERGEPAISSGDSPIAEVTISGPQSRVERVVQVRAVANIEQLRASYLAPLSLSPVDEARRPVEGVVVSPPAVTVLIPINSVVGLKLVPVAPLIIGQPAPGYAVTGVEVSPPLIALTGSSGPLDAVASLATEAVDISAARSSLLRDVALIIPTGTAPGAGEPMRVTITVRVEPITRPFQAQLPAQVTAVGGDGSLLVGLSQPVVSVTLSGTSAALNALAQTALRAEVNIAGLGPGSYDLPVNVALPPGVSLVGAPPVVTVTLRTPPPPATPTGTAEPISTAEPPGETPTAEAPTAEPTVEPTAEPTAEPTGTP